MGDGGRPAAPALGPGDLGVAPKLMTMPRTSLGEEAKHSRPGQIHAPSIVPLVLNVNLLLSAEAQRIDAVCDLIGGSPG